jgi:Tfp pilus assembly protein PilX
MTTDKKQEQGFVAIVVAALIMVILSLITIGFTRMMQREQQQAVDRQLTRQALYAAESGINDVYNGLVDGTLAQIEKTDCDVSGLPNDGVISESTNVAYTCVLYDKTPGELNYSISTSDSKVSPLKTESGRIFSSVTIRWSQEKGLNNIPGLPDCAAAGVFPASRAGNVPLLRVDFSNTTTLARDNLINSTDYLYLAPCRGAGTATYRYVAGAKGTVVPVVCAAGAALPCTLTINGLASNSYVARIRSVYDSAQVSIDGLEQLGGGATGPAEFADSQTSIDVTARAADVVRRLRVAVPIGQPNNSPESVLQAFDGVCKLLSVDLVSVPNRVTDNCTY